MAALVQFNSHARATLGTSSPTLGPMSSILLRTESTSSSQIENLTVGARQLALAEAEADPVAALDAARRAMTHATDADALARFDAR